MAKENQNSLQAILKIARNAQGQINFVVDRLAEFAGEQNKQDVPEWAQKLLKEFSEPVQEKIKQKRAYRKSRKYTTRYAYMVPEIMALREQKLSCEKIMKKLRSEKPGQDVPSLATLSNIVRNYKKAA